MNALHAQRDDTIADHDPVAAVEVFEQRRVVDADDGARNSTRPRSPDVTIDAGVQLDAAARERRRAHLRSGEIGEHSDDGAAFERPPRGPRAGGRCARRAGP